MLKRLFCCICFMLVVGVIGSCAKNLSAQLYINDVPSDEMSSDFSICQYDDVWFRVETDFDIHHLEWSFGDGATLSSVDTEVSHAYISAAGSRRVTSVIYCDLKTEVQPFDTLTAVFPIYPVTTVNINLVSCDDTPGYYYDTLHTSHGCDSIVITKIEPGPLEMEEIYDMSCEEYVFRDSVFTTGGRHLYQVEMEEGCDSLYILYLTIGFPPENPECEAASCDTFQWHGIKCFETGDYISPTSYITNEGCVYDSILHFTHTTSDDVFDTIVTCDSYYWEDVSVSLTQGGDYDTILISGGCETNYLLHLVLSHTPPFNEIKGFNYVSVATNYWPAEYVYYVDDSTGMDTQLIEWELSDNENGEWGFIPHGASCTVIAYTQGTKELTASSSDAGFCGVVVSKTINCTGFAVDEIETMSLKVYPNPASEELFIEDNEIKKIKIYNLLGQIIKEVNVDGESRVRVGVSDLPQALYLVNVITRFGNKTQLVSVIK